MKKLIGIVFLGLILFSCSSPEEIAFNNCIKELKGEKYKGKEINEVLAAVMCQKLKKKYPDIFQKSKGKFLSFIKEINN